MSYLVLSRYHETDEIRICANYLNKDEAEKYVKWCKSLANNNAFTFYIVKKDDK